MLWFFSNEKNFNQDKKSVEKKGRWIYSDPNEVPKMMLTKFILSVMVL